jgi:hypothetical protein
VIRVPVLNDGTLTIKNRDGERSEAHPPHPNLHQPLIDDFAQAVLEDRQPRVGGASGREVAKVEADIYERSD